MGGAAAKDEVGRKRHVAAPGRRHVVGIAPFQGHSACWLYNVVNHTKVVGFSTSGRAAISFNERPPSTRSYTLTPPPSMPPNIIQRPSSPPILAPRRCCKPVCTSAMSGGLAGSSSEKIARGSPAALGSFRLVAYKWVPP